MKRLGIKNLTKQIICIIIVLMLCNFIMPNTTYAVNKNEDGGTMFAPFSKFITFLCDNIMQFLQNSFTTTEKIDNGDGTYNYQYSPAIIFSGEVPAFDINFISPNDKKTSSYLDFINKNEKQYYKDVTNDSSCNIEKEEFDSKYQSAKQHEGAQTIINSKSLSITTRIVHYEETRENKQVLCVEYFVETIWRNTEVDTTTYSYKKYEYNMNDASFEESINVYESTAAILQPTIITWYKALRRIALVGLLSILVYIGIRIVLLTIEGKENSKYKKMLIDWLVAICLLYTIHYAMSIIITMTQKISSLFNMGETDQLLNLIRGRIESSATWGVATSNVIMYVVLTIYTITFSFQYIKRVLYIGFFTTIAPLVTLTYPLDKIKDSKAQAFSMWLKEYIFNALIQVVHLIVYYTLVGSAVALTARYPIYAIIAIGFIITGEKIIRKMFGFNNAETVGQLTAAATGGLVSDAMNKLSNLSKSSKTKSSAGSSSSNANSSSNIRTASNNALASLRDGGSSGEGAPSLGIKNAIGGATSLGGKFIKTAGGAALRGGLGVTGAMLGFAAGVSQGDLKAAGAGLLAGGKAGSAVGKGAVNLATSIPGGITNAVNSVKDTWNKGAFGADFAQSASEAREFKRTSAYKSLSDKYGDKLTDESLRAMLDADIKDAKTMEKVLDSGNISDAIGYYTLAKKCPDSIYYDDNKLKMYLEDLGLSQTDAETMRRNMRTFR